MKRIISTFLLVLMLSTVAIAKNDTPESVSVKATPDAVKSAIVARLTMRGYHLENDSAYQMVWTKEMNGGAGIMTQVIAGNANCAMPKHVVTIAFVSSGDSVQLIGTQQVDKAGAFCARERIDLNGKKNHEQMHGFLADIKVNAETPVK